MTAEEAPHLPESDSALDAFSQVNQQHFMIGKTANEIVSKDQKTIVAAGRDYFVAGLRFLENHGYDPYLREVGRVAQFWVSKNMIGVLFTSDVVVAARAMGIPETKVTEDVERKPNEPHVFIGNMIKGKIVQTGTRLLIPVGFIVNAQRQPIEAIAALAGIGSEIRDISYAMDIIDPGNLRGRAEATQAHFLKEATARHPEIGLSPHLRLALANYPEGIKSLHEGRYKLGNRGYV